MGMKKTKIIIAFLMTVIMGLSGISLRKHLQSRRSRKSLRTTQRSRQRAKLRQKKPLRMQMML